LDDWKSEFSTTGYLRIQVRKTAYADVDRQQTDIIICSVWPFIVRGLFGWVVGDQHMQARLLESLQRETKPNFFNFEKSNILKGAIKMSVTLMECRGFGGDS
jgi:hypothetical protein